MSDARPSQSYATHRRWHPLFHFIGFPILALNVIVAIVYLARNPTLWSAWNVIVAVALLISIFLARYYALKVQNRLIRLEETLRLTRCLPEELRSRVGELSTNQFVALRFCADEELPELTRSVLADNVRDRGEIKRRIKSWRGDWQRV
jgi:hypothetical protein